MPVVVLARVKRSDRSSNPTGLVVSKTLGGCACAPLTKARRKKRGSKAYLAWLESNVPGLRKKIAAFLKKEAERVFDDVHESLVFLTRVRKVSPEEIEHILGKIDFSRWTSLIGVVEDDLVEAFKENAKAGFDAIRFTPEEDVVELVNANAQEWASRRAAELVGMRKAPDGTYVPNPNAKWAISDTTRDSIRDLVTDAVDEGWSVDTFKDELMSAHAFSAERAETVARTELAFAHVEGNLDAWRTSGVVAQKQSILGSEHDLDDTCNENADAGPIPLDAEFPSGHQGAPYHPNCVCDVIPVMEED